MPGVLKGGAAGVPPHDRSTCGRVQAEALEARARALLAEAEAVVRAARQEAEGLRAEAARAGREEGRADAAATLLAAAEARDRLLAGARGELVELALAMAEKVLRRTLAREREAVRELAEAALAEARGRRVVRLRLHPDDLAALEPARTALSSIVATEALELLADPALRPGDAVVETEAGLADARIEVQLSALRRALREVR